MTRTTTIVTTGALSGLILLVGALPAWAADVRDHVEAVARAPDSEKGREATRAVIGQGLAAAPKLVPLLEDPEPNVRAVACSLLGQLPLQELRDDTVVDALLGVLQKDTNLSAKLSAALALGTTRSPKATEKLTALLDNEDVLLRRIAPVALMRVGDQHAVPALVRKFKADDDVDLRLNILRALGKLRAYDELAGLRGSAANEVLQHEFAEQLKTREVPRHEAQPAPEAARAEPKSAAAAPGGQLFAFARPYLFPAGIGLGVLLLILWWVAPLVWPRNALPPEKSGEQ